MSDATSQETRDAAAAVAPKWAVDRIWQIWQIPEPECDCQRQPHEARPAHPATMIGKRNA